ncbi:hypothetical protein B0A48_12490 [Cryoendolithus antarcticus]|uniref:Plasma membrane proteolipid 3 n=1 Tax=Cryoendolithus antarcticus TaxID=1507870 RepID=A0A1V8SS59_9PEZI|nr:hypothetical protein B0A48_12490 [Cryoendolithus antarcticus]
MRALAYRVVITIINIFFPPLAVMMLAGLHWDCMFNCLLFLAAKIPPHVHGFYVSCTYFRRRGKVKKGRYPGGPKSLIHSPHVLNGGASNAEVERLCQQESGLKRRSSSRRAEGSSSSSPVVGREYVDRRPQMLEKYGSYSGSVHETKLIRAARERKWAEGVARDGYGVPGSPPQGLAYAGTGGSRTGRSGWRV